MLAPGEDDYIDIHTHGRATSPGVFKVKCLLTHQTERPHDYPEAAVSVGSHPWFLNEENFIEGLETVVIASSGQNVVAIGETGLDKVKGPDMALQIKAFEKQVDLANRLYKPVIVHCVKAWDELISVHTNIKPQTPWLIHGFMGSKELAKQLTERGFFISLWYSFALSDRSTELIKALPIERLFLETDSSDSDIREIYAKVAGDLNIPVSGLKSRLVKNYFDLTPSRCKCCGKGC